MADTSSPGVTPPASASPIADRSGDDDLLIDVAGFARLLWRFRLAILLAVVAGGALGLAYFRSLPPAFLGRSVLTLTLAPGTAPAASQMERFQALAGDLAVITSALEDAGLGELSPPAVQSLTTTRVGQPGTLIIVETQWPDADTAGRVASAVATRALTALKERWEKETSDSVAARVKELADAEQEFQRSRMAFADSWLTGRPAVSGSGSTAIERELDETLKQMPPLWARLDVARSRLAALPPTAPVLESAAIRSFMVDAEMRLAELSAQRELLIFALPRSGPVDPLMAWSEFDARVARLEYARRNARRKANASIQAVEQARAAMSQPVGLELVEPSFSPGRRIGPGSAAFIARGLASGLLFSVFAVFFFNGMARNFFGRRI